jgi:hypothetical protein
MREALEGSERLCATHEDHALSTAREWLKAGRGEESEGDGTMTPEQKTAVANHCRFAFETAQRKFGHQLRYGATLVLTVNSGYE